MKQPEQTKEEKTAEQILQKHCPSMDDIFLDYSGRQFRERIIKAMDEFASQKCKALQEENERLKENLDYWRENERDRIQVLEEALREARTFITEADDDGEGKEDWIILKTIEQALTGSQSKD